VIRFLVDFAETPSGENPPRSRRARSDFAHDMENYCTARRNKQKLFVRIFEASDFSQRGST